MKTSIYPFTAGVSTSALWTSVVCVFWAHTSAAPNTLFATVGYFITWSLTSHAPAPTDRMFNKTDVL